MRRLQRSLIWPALLATTALIIVPACVGDAPGGGTPATADAGVQGGADAAPQADGGANPIALTVSGMVMDYQLANLGTNQPLEATLATAGLNPPVSGSSLGDGSYNLANIPPGSLFYVHAERANYRPTRNESVEIVDASVSQSLYAVSSPDVLRWYSSMNIIETPDTAFVAVDMYRNNGDPLVAVTALDVKIVDGLGVDVATAYFFGPAGDPRDNIVQPEATLYNGKSRAGFYNIAPGEYQISITYLNGAGEPMTQLVPITTIAGGVTLARSGGGGVNPPPPPAGNLTFTNDVYPILQRAALGGDACSNCHTIGGAAALLPFDGDAASVHAAIIGRVNVINLDNPELSLLITKPMYEDPPNHPNATYADINAPSLQIFLAWIAQGAVL